MTIPTYDFLILYGTQTGQSKAIAESISERAEEQHGLKTKVCCLSLFDKEFFLEQESVVVVVISSTGDGDPPESTLKFFRKLNRKTLASDTLSNLQFALLGLGDTNYNNFCACPKRLEKRFLNLGAKQFYPSGYCDDAVGTELVAEPWIEGLFVAVKRFLGRETLTEMQEDNVENRIKCLKIESTEEQHEEIYENFCCSLTSNSLECFCNWPKPSLTFSSHLHEIAELKVPILSPPFLSVSFSEEPVVNKFNDQIQNAAEFPSKYSPIHSAVLVSRQKLTKIGAKKSKYSVWIEIVSEIFDVNCSPGDAFYFVCPNPSDEVHWLLRRLNVNALAEKKCVVSVLPETTKKNPAVPLYIPPVSTLRYIFTYCVDFRRPISRSLLRILVEHCKNPADSRRLMELVSNQGVNEYNEYVRVNGLNLLDVLHAFPSCFPPTERLLEHLPRLQPRPLSVASSTLNERRRFRFVYNLVDMCVGKGRFYRRQGVCTGYLTNAAIHSKLLVFLKKPSQFRLPSELNVPIIMVGPGTGVAPFLAFLENLRFLKNNDHSTDIAERWLFFGCRDKNRDYIFRDELESFAKSGFVNVHVCYSQYPTEPSGESAIRYVQHNIIKFGPTLANLLTSDEKTKIFVCGDAKNMANDVFSAFADVLVAHEGMSKQAALEYLKSLQEQHRYLQDVWT